MRVKEIPSSALRPPPAHPILKKPSGPQSTGPRPTARFASPHVSEDEAENQDDIPSSGSTITPGLEMRAATIKSPPKKKASGAGRKFVASAGKRRPVMARRTSSQSTVVGSVDTVSTREGAASFTKSPRMHPRVASPVKDPLPTLDDVLAGPTEPNTDGTPPRPSEKALGKRPAIPYTLPRNPRPTATQNPRSGEKRAQSPTKLNAAPIERPLNEPPSSHGIQTASKSTASDQLSPKSSPKALSPSEKPNTLPNKSNPTPVEQLSQEPLSPAKIPTVSELAPVEIQQKPRALSDNQATLSAKPKPTAVELRFQNPLSWHDDRTTLPRRGVQQLSQPRRPILALPDTVPAKFEPLPIPRRPSEPPPIPRRPSKLLSSYEDLSALSKMSSPPAPNPLPTPPVRQLSLVDFPSLPQVDEGTAKQADSDISDPLSDTSTAVDSARIAPIRSHSGLIRYNRGFSQGLSTNATALTTTVEVQGTIIDQSGNTSPLPINGQGAVKRFDGDMPTSPTSILDSHLIPTPPSNAPPVPLGRTRSQLNILLDRENERLARKGWTRG